MIKKVLIVIALAAPTTWAQTTGTIGALTHRMASAGEFSAKADFEVLLPSAADPVTYTVDLVASPTPADSLSPCAYLIRWTSPVEGDGSVGFTSYFAGHHYRFSGDRLQEYHTDWDLNPFIPGGNTADGIQRTARFADLLPAFLAEHINAIAADTTYKFTYTPDATVDGRKSAVIKGVQSVRGMEGLEYTYVFDPATGLPLRIDLDYNPGSISEQSVSVRYSYPSAELSAVPQAETDLALLFPEVFEKYRSSNFHIENLAGRPLPAFSAPTITGERFTHNRGDAMRAPTIIALLDPAVGTPAEVVESLRTAAASLPFDTDIIWAFVSNNTSDIEDIVGTQARIGEQTLMGARALARDAGVTALPVVILTDAAGNVTNIILGINNNLASDVIQKMAVAN